MSARRTKRPPYHRSLAGTILAAREAVMSPIRPHLRAANLTEQQWRVLRVLVDEGDTDASGLARSALLYAPTVTRILKELGARKLLVRRSSPQDGRRFLIAATPAGRTLVESTARHTSKLLQEYERRFGESRLRALQAELVAFTEAIASLSNQASDGDD